MLRQIQTAAFPPSMSIQTGLDLYKLYAYKCFVCSLHLKCSERSSPTSQSFPMQEQSRQYYVTLSSIYKAFTTMLLTPYCESIVFFLDNPQVVPVSGLLWLKTVVQLSWLRVFLEWRIVACGGSVSEPPVSECLTVSLDGSFPHAHCRTLME